MLIPIIGACLILTAFIGGTIYNHYEYKHLKKYLADQSKNTPHELSTSGITHDRMTDIEHSIAHIPNKVLESINGSISNNKGKLAELIAYVNLKANYDKVIPLGNIVDFIGIRFPTDTDPGTFDFIDVKNGKSARLSDDQKQLQKLIQLQRIQFLKIKIVTDNVIDLAKDDIAGTDPEV